MVITVYGGMGLAGEDRTREKILKAAKEEFLTKGFRDASLRKITDKAGVTTGSLYWHFKNKDELFDAIVGDHYQYIMDLYQDGLDRFFAMSNEDQKTHLGDIGDACMAQLLEYIYQNKVEFQILIEGAADTKYGNMIHELTESEISSTHVLAQHMRELGIESKELSPILEHILVSGMFTGLLELITHDVPFETARRCAQQLHAFHTAGWRHIMNIPEQ